MATAGASDTSQKSNLLAEMYRPPFELMSQLPWDEARDEGKENEKWIIVNIQDPAIFDCQVLNRDIWKNPQIKETVKENFIFMQYSKDDPRGNNYVQYYFHTRDSLPAHRYRRSADRRAGQSLVRAPCPKTYGLSYAIA
jgi:thioredoxin-related protein